MHYEEDRSLSETDLNKVETTPPNTYITTRHKRKREEDALLDLSSFKDEIRAMISSMMATQLSEIRKNTQTLNEIQITNKNIEDSVSFLSKQYEDFQKKISCLETKIAEDKIQIQNLEYRIDELQRESRKNHLEIKNVPKKPKESKEDLLNMILTLSNTISCPLQRSDIIDIYRLRPKKEGNNSPIIIELASSLVKNDVLRMCKAHNLKHKTNLNTSHLGLHTEVNLAIFVAEQLTAKASRLYFLARELKRRKIFKHCWTSYGKVYLRKNDSTQIINVTNESQIEQLSKEDVYAEIVKPRTIPPTTRNKQTTIATSNNAQPNPAPAVLRKS